MGEAMRVHGGAVAVDADPVVELLDVLAEQRAVLMEMRGDLARIGEELVAIRREAHVHDDATRRQLGQVASGQDRRR